MIDPIPDPNSSSPPDAIAWTRIIFRLALTYDRLFASGLGGHGRPKTIDELWADAASMLTKIERAARVQIADRGERKRFMRGLEQIAKEELAGIDGRAT